MKEIVVKRIEHRQLVWVGVYGPDEKLFNHLIRLQKAVWSKTWKCWLISWDRQLYKQFLSRMEKHYHINDDAIRKITTQNGAIQNTEKKTPDGFDGGWMEIKMVNDPAGLKLWEERQR
ncbi:hypothetical protein [Pollutibacter soli]|uniref:hypothetical protein n=1 Tax=Pollutibacter soli TaxID=3034157 RepID=UPI003013F08A